MRIVPSELPDRTLPSCHARSAHTGPRCPTRIWSQLHTNPFSSSSPYPPSSLSSPSFDSSPLSPALRFAPGGDGVADQTRIVRSPEPEMITRFPSPPVRLLLLLMLLLLLLLLLWRKTSKAGSTKVTSTYTVAPCPSKICKQLHRNNQSIDHTFMDPSREPLST